MRHYPGQDSGGIAEPVHRVLCRSVARGLLQIDQQMGESVTLPAASWFRGLLDSALCWSASVLCPVGCALWQGFHRSQLVVVSPAGGGACHRRLLSLAPAHVSLSLQACPSRQSTNQCSAELCPGLWYASSKPCPHGSSITSQVRGMLKNCYQSAQYSQACLKVFLVC